jgi:hypothetical protein
MSGLFVASLKFRRTSLAFGLCLLAFLFAVEAKTAWYGPVVGLGSSVRAAKALPEVTPKVVERNVSAPDPAHLQFAFAVLPPAADARLTHVSARAGGAIVFHHLPLFIAAYFSPSSFFRPPPAL